MAKKRKTRGASLAYKSKAPKKAKKASGKARKPAAKARKAAAKARKPAASGRKVEIERRKAKAKRRVGKKAAPIRSRKAARKPQPKAATRKRQPRRFAKPTRRVSKAAQASRLARERKRLAKERASLARERKRLERLRMEGGLFAAAPSDVLTERRKQRAKEALASHLTAVDEKLTHAELRNTYNEWADAKLDLIDDIGAVQWESFMEEVADDFDLPDGGSYSERSFADSSPSAEA